MRLVTMICLIALIAAGAAWAYAPPAMTFQGRVTEAGGAAVPDGNHSLTFRIYDQISGGAPLWSSTRNVNVQNGIFSVVLGQNTPLTLPFDEAYFIGVQYEAEAEMTPRVPLTSAPFTLGVSEDAAVTALNGRTGEIQLLAGTNVTITPVAAGFVISATGAVSDNDWTVVGNDMYSTPSGNVGIGQTSPASKLHVGGDATLGASGTPGSLFAYNTGTSSPSLFGGTYAGEGSQMAIRDEEGNTYMGAQPDVDDTGGFFWVQNGNFGSAFQVDGNYLGSGDPRITMFGSGSSAVFNLGETANAAAQLPGSSVSAAEMFDEPGLASLNAHGSSSFLVPDSYGVVSSRTISAPTDGFILAMCSLEIDLRHEGTNSSYVTAGLSLSPNTVDNNQDLSYYLPSSAANGIYLVPSTPTAVYPVSAGDHTVYLNARKVGTSTSYIWDTQLNLVFIPTAYGSVALSDGFDGGDQLSNTNQSPALTSGDIAAEQRASIQANDDRVARELADLRAQIQALQQEMSSRNGDPGVTAR